MRFPQSLIHQSVRVECACWLLGLLLCSAVQATQARALQKTHATVPYSISGKQTVLGPDGAIGKYAVGGQVVFYHSLTDKGVQIGHVAGHCHIVSQQGPRTWISVCTKHYDWLDGSTMTAHATEIVGPDNKIIKSRLVIAGGVGRWEGAHGEDANYVYDPASGSGTGKIVLYCLGGFVDKTGHSRASSYSSNATFCVCVSRELRRQFKFP